MCIASARVHSPFALSLPRYTTHDSHTHSSLACETQNSSCAVVAVSLPSLYNVRRTPRHRHRRRSCRCRRASVASVSFPLAFLPLSLPLPLTLSQGNRGECHADDPARNRSRVQPVPPRSLLLPTSGNFLPPTFNFKRFVSCCSRRSQRQRM